MYYRYSGQYGVVWVAQKGVGGALAAAYSFPGARHPGGLLSRLGTHNACTCVHMGAASPCLALERNTGMCVLRCGWQGCAHHMYSRTCRGTREPGCHVMLSCHVVDKAEHRMGHIGGREHLHWAMFTPALLRMHAAHPAVLAAYVHHHQCVACGELDWCVQQEWTTVVAGPPVSLLSHPACDSPHVTSH